MNAEELIRMARKQAEYDGSLIPVLKSGIDKTWENALQDLDGDEQDVMFTAIETLNSMIEEHGQPMRMAITIIAFEIQIENAKMKQSERNN